MVSGPSRNLTSVFIKHRTENKNKKNRFGYSILGGSPLVGLPSSQGIHAEAGHQRLLGSMDTRSEADQQEVEMTSLPPVWVDLVEEAQEDLTRIKDKLTALQKAQQKRLLKVFSGDHADANKEVESITSHIQALFRRCESRIVQIQTRGAGAHLSDTELRLRQNAQRSLASQLQAMSMQWKTQQKNYGKELEKRKGGTDIFTKKADSMADDDLFSERQAQELEHLEKEVDQRNEEIAKIARSVADLQTIFKELAVLVIDQGTLLDRIDYNVEQVVQQTSDANVQIEKARKYQQSGRVAKCVMGLVISIFVCIVLLFIKHSSHHRRLEAVYAVSYM